MRNGGEHLISTIYSNLKVIVLIHKAIQQLLDEECSNLDLQCEAAVAYKNIYRNSNLTVYVP